MKDRAKKSILLIAIGIFVNVALAITKMYVGLSSNSLCIMLDSVNSFFDVLTCVATLAFLVALLFPRSDKAPYGYGRGEYLAGFIVSVVSVVVGGLFFLRSINRLAMPEPVWFSVQNCALICATLPVKLAMGLTYYFCNKKLHSSAVKAIMLDSFLDIGVTATSIVSFAISSRVDYAVDAIFGIVISVIIVVFAVKMVADNVRSIVVGDGAKQEREAVDEICRAHEVRLEKLVLHDYGYSAKAGEAIVDCSEDVLESLHDETLEKTGADVTFVRKRK